MENTRRARAANTQRMVARRIGVSPSQFCQMLKGKKRPSPPMASRLEVLTGIGIRTWLFGKPDEIRRELEKVYGKINFKRGRVPGKREVKG